MVHPAQGVQRENHPTIFTTINVPSNSRHWPQQATTKQNKNYKRTPIQGNGFLYQS